MSGHRETNPYFEVPHLQPEFDPNRRSPRLHQQYEFPQQLPTPTPHSPPPPQPSSPPPHRTRTPHVHPSQHRTRTRTRTRTPPPRRGSETDHFPVHQTQTSPPRRGPKPDHFPVHQTQTPPPRRGSKTDHFPVHQTQTSPPRRGQETDQLPVNQPRHHSTQPSPDEPTRPPSKLRIPQGRKTKPYTWLLGAVCALFWIAVVLGGLVVLVVYLLFRPRGPKFDIAAASLNAAYLDMGYLLNADMTILANFTNPSKKATVDFHYIYVNLYFGNTLVSTTYVEPFKAMKVESAFRNVHLVSSQVGLPLRERQKMMQQIEGNRIRFEVKASLRTRSNLGSLFRYSYWLFGHCLIEVTGPPSGVLVGKKCMTKR
ncbi:hypothetical protein RHSIM_Rhsim12G0108200 [Rhododendron simsii]|uniref:Late embryogenesis abundant protein LEA-2 subgroup domain-containing protein n=1 Tax=Rhododendron simsii TaxID=118357 RepID=A0A834G8Q1_RHOSS|nr:hypothetical protein RHSIM_Rhsim12G0108200 [Rhododendron simsii]